MATYRIENTHSGLILGDYKADSPKKALELLAQDSGYKTYAEMQKVAPTSESEISVCELWYDMKLTPKCVRSSVGEISVCELEDLPSKNYRFGGPVQVGYDD